MRIKSRYYTEGVFPKLQSAINEALEPFPDFRDELFERLYDFFQRYFSETGSIFFRQTPLHQSVYEQVYTDDKDVMLFWKTHMLYYVKTDRLFKSMDVDLDGRTFFFDASRMEHKKANEKRAAIFSFEGKRKDGALVFSVSFSERGRKTKTAAILKALRRDDDSVTEDTIERAFRVFERQSDVDYFISKKAKAFLEEQFELWVYQYMFKGVSEWTELRVRQLQVLRDITFKIIGFVSQFEDELVRIWKKPKFAIGSNYVITLDRISGQYGGPEVIERLLVHSGFPAQVEEWQQLGIVDDSFTKSSVLEGAGRSKVLTHRYQYLPVDTKYFKDVELDILGLFADLDESLDGWLVRSENYQALKTVVPKFRGRVACVYIDPPYNGEGSEILYLNRYCSSSWLTLMENRLDLVSDFFQQDNHALVVAVDDYEMANLVTLLESKFPSYEVNPIVVNHHPQGSPKANISRTHEYAILVTPQGSDFVRVPRSEEKPDERPLMRTGTAENNFRRGRPNSFYAIIVDPDSGAIQGVEPPPVGADCPMGRTDQGFVRLYPIDSRGQERVWRKSYESGLRAVAEGLIYGRLGANGPSLYERVSIDRVKPTSNWVDSRYNAGMHGTQLLTSLFGKPDVFSYPKSIHSVSDIVDAVIYDDDEAIVLDFFAGSGTTAHALINLNRADGGRRRYVLVEMAEYCDSVILPRIKKAVFSDEWDEGKAVDGRGVGHFVKYFALEQYEDTLRRAKYRQADLFDDPDRDPYHQYVFLRDLKLLEALEADPGRNEVSVDPSRLYDGIDIAETLSNLTGKWIRRINADPSDATSVGAVEFEDGEVADVKNLDWTRIKPLIWW
jgi:adenine-specific DNA-methyltransferase